MNSENRELSIEELGAVTGRGIVDTVLPNAETGTNEFLKSSAEASLRFNTFIKASTAGQAPTANQE